MEKCTEENMHSESLIVGLHNVLTRRNLNFLIYWYLSLYSYQHIIGWVFTCFDFIVIVEYVKL